MTKIYLCIVSLRPDCPDPVNPLPPLECLRFFEAAARHESFARAAEELRVTPAAVAHRMRTLERYLGAPLFSRRQRSVRLNRRGRAYYEAIRRILRDIHRTTRHHADGRRLRGR
ncbi:LysR family transcriptional regulator [Candidatus Rariloculus sp.]|uniref:LysR family transcriptional regulator n=1 Tax=Candidatus Rariloculus sp. TaxID=3101265 RepID=UPI003D0B0D3A